MFFGKGRRTEKWNKTLNTQNIYPSFEATALHSTSSCCPDIYIQQGLMFQGLSIIFPVSTDWVEMSITVHYLADVKSQMKFVAGFI